MIFSRLIARRSFNIHQFQRIRNELHLLKRTQSPILYTQREFKDFGHAYRADSKWTVAFLAFLVFCITLPNLRYVVDNIDLYEEGDERDLPDEQRIYQIELHYSGRDI